MTNRQLPHMEPILASDLRPGQVFFFGEGVCDKCYYVKPRPRTSLTSYHQTRKFIAKRVNCGRPGCDALPRTKAKKTKTIRGLWTVYISSMSNAMGRIEA